MGLAKQQVYIPRLPNSLQDLTDTGFVRLWTFFEADSVYKFIDRLDMIRMTLDAHNKNFRIERERF
jgi:hypothetical protein